MGSRMLLVVMAVFLVLMLTGCPPPPEEDNDVVVIAPDNDVQTVNVGLGEWYITLEPDAVPAGEITFNITNEGDVLHALEIQNDVDARSENLTAGESTTMTEMLSAGTYEVICPISNHADQGMRATLTVTDDQNQ